MFPGMNNTRFERKILIILDFENGFLPTYLPLWSGEQKWWPENRPFPSVPKTISTFQELDL